MALHEEQAVGKAGGPVRDQGRLRGVQHLDLRFERGEEDRLPLANEFRDADAEELLAAGGGGVHAADHPLRVADQDPGAGSEGDLGRRRRGLVHGCERVYGGAAGSRRSSGTAAEDFVEDLAVGPAGFGAEAGEDDLFDGAVA